VTCAVGEPRLTPHKLTSIIVNRQKPSASWAFVFALDAFGAQLSKV
jgi:hypothetical protein